MAGQKLPVVRTVFTDCENHEKRLSVLAMLLCWGASRLCFESNC